MWISLALFKALDSAVTTSLTKKLTKSLHPLLVTVIQNLFFLIFVFIAIILFLGGIPKVTPLFFALLLCSGILDAFAYIASTWAIKHAPISLISPLSACTPVFATLFGFLFLHETPSLIKLIGVITIVCGTYTLNISHIKNGILAPFKKLFTNKGVGFFFITMAIYGITPVFQKQAIFQTHPTVPVFASFIDNVFAVIFLSFFALKHVQREKKAIKHGLWIFLTLGILNMLGQIAAYAVFASTYLTR